MALMMTLFNLICIFSFTLMETIAQDLPEKSHLETYIVRVEAPDAQLSSDSGDLENWYSSFLPKETATSNTASSLVYSYKNVIKGFAARLTPEEVKVMEKKKGFVSAQKQEKLSLHTTHSPGFLGLQQNFGFWNGSNYGKGVIIGVLDTGIRSDHPSFRDEGMPPPPAKWKGKCEFKPPHLCNDKIIGAKYFVQDGDGTVLDENGHGTHTAGTAAGNFVKGANVFGNAAGTAAGIAPLAHLAIYKVCDSDCADSDILAAMDSAIEDGVDVLSISIGSLQETSKPFYNDYVALGAYSAMEKGIFVSCSAGNSGPLYVSLSNVAPWMLTVGASTTDRKIRSIAVLGNHAKLQGESAFQPKNFTSPMFPLVYPGSNGSNLNCLPDSINSTHVRGKMVLCMTLGSSQNVEQGKYVKAAGGAAMMIVNPDLFGYTTFASPHVLPASHVSYSDTLKVLEYMNSTKSPTATIFFNGTAFGDFNAPSVAGFSSRGPSFASPGILKPDILGPGVNILAAWHLSVENITGTKSTFNILSGTSMSCPHLSGVAALLKSARPDWSPGAIKSAMMTTAEIVNMEKKPIVDQDLQSADIFATGAGQVNPSRANDPGLVYDLEPKDYVPYLCGLNYTNREVGMILQRQINCSLEPRILEAELNYPSFSILFGPTVQKYRRTVTNVGEAISSYKVEIAPPEGVNVTVVPSTLNFHSLNQRKTYEVTFSLLQLTPDSQIAQGFIKWNSGKHSVRSPIAVLVGI